MLYQLFVGRMPFPGKGEYQIFLKSTKGEFPDPPTFLMPPDVLSLVRRMLSMDPEARPTVREVLQDSSLDIVRELTQMPAPTPFEYHLRTLFEDYIKRHNVYEFDGNEKFQQTKEQAREQSEKNM